MHNDLALDAVNDVFLLPCKIVMILQVEQHPSAKMFGDVPVDAGMVRRGVLTHQLHRRPVFLTFRGIQ